MQTSFVSVQWWFFRQTNYLYDELSELFAPKKVSFHKVDDPYKTTAKSVINFRQSNTNLCTILILLICTQYRTIFQENIVETEKDYIDRKKKDRLTSKECFDEVS